MNMPLPPPPQNPDDPGRGIWFMGVTWALTSLTLLAIGTRFWVRITLTFKIYIEEWIMLLAVLLNLAAQSLLTVSYHYGLGMHDEDLTLKQAIQTSRWIWMSYTPAILSSATARISITILLVRIFAPNGARVLKWFLIITTALSVAAVVAQIITVWNQFDPVEGLWNPLAGATLRFSPDIAMIEGNIIGALFAFGDLAYVLAPVLVVWKLNMPLRQKVGLIVLLSLSLVTMGISIAKAVNATSSAGSLYNNTLGLFFAIVEQAFVIILGCAPPLASVSKLKLPSAILSMTSLARRLVSRSRNTQYIIQDSSERGQDGYETQHELLEGSKPTSSVHAGASMGIKPQSNISARRDQFRPTDTTTAVANASR